MMGSAVSAFGTGFATGLSLIMAIGAQNAFVLRQGLMRRHVFAIALLCAASDALLIAAGVGGISLFVAEFAKRHVPLLFGFAGLWLAFSRRNPR
jgi:L-lysine exporter family protein LysE/ArgO